MASSSSKVNASASHLSRMAETLQSLIGGFKVEDNFGSRPKPDGEA
jgi:hypothetical protein